MADPATRPYRTEIPNLIDDLDLSPYAFRLYAHIKRIAGPSGSCYEGGRKLAERCRMSTGQVSAAKKELIERGLIVKSQKETRGGMVDEFTPVDLWQQNYDRYSVQDMNGSVHTVNTNTESVHTVNESVHTVNVVKNKEERTKKKNMHTPPAVPSEPTDHQKIMNAYANVLAYPIRDGPKEGNAAKWLANNHYTPEQVQACYAHLKVQAFYAKQHVSLQTVASQIGAYLQSKNGHNNGKHLRSGAGQHSERGAITEADPERGF